MIRDQESRELFEADKKGLKAVMVEPVLGCGKFVCPQCCVDSMPREQSMMREADLDASLKLLKDKGANPREFQYSLRGETLDHPRLHKLTELIRGRYPNAKVSAITSLSGIDDYGTLESRTKGLNGLVVSLDGHHYARMLNIMRDRGELNPEKLAEKGFETKKEAVFGELRKRLRWAAAASQKNKFVLGVNLIGSEKERKAMRDLLESALPGDNPRLFKVFNDEERDERGCDLQDEFSRLLNIFHDGKMGYFFPKGGEK